MKMLGHLKYRELFEEDLNRHVDRIVELFKYVKRKLISAW